MAKTICRNSADDLFAATEGIQVEHPLMFEMESRIGTMICVGESNIDKDKKCMALIAESGCGKSTIIRHCTSKLNEGRNVDECEIPALYVVLTPAVGKKSLAQDILIALRNMTGRETHPESGNETILLERVCAYLRFVKCKILFIDEFHHVLLSDTPKKAKAVGETVKWLLTNGPCPVVVVGTEEAREPFKQNNQLLRRAVPSIDLRKLSIARREDREWFGKFFGRFFGIMEEQSIASNATSLVLDETLSLLMEASDGIIGNACKIVSHAVYQMALAGRSELDGNDFRIACDNLLILTSITKNPFAASAKGISVSARHDGK